MNLADVAVGDTCVIERLTGGGPIRRRIMDMGITRGVEVKVVKVAPMGDPLQLSVRGYDLSLRKEDAQRIEVR